MFDKIKRIFNDLIRDFRIKCNSSCCNQIINEAEHNSDHVHRISEDDTQHQPPQVNLTTFIQPEQIPQ